jgi:hypothetical protein
MNEEINKEEIINKALDEFFKEDEGEEGKVKAEERIKEEEGEITYPHQIAPFWRNPINHPFKDLYFEIYYVVKNEDGSRKWLPVNLPIDPKVGRVVPPFTEEEIIEAGYGPGKYILRPRSIKTGKLLPGTETHILGMSQEYRQKEDLMRIIEARKTAPVYPQYQPPQPIEEKPQFDMFRFFKEMMEIITKQQEKMIEMMKTQTLAQPQTKGDLNAQVTALVSAIMGVLKEMEKSKATIETKKMEIDKEIKLKELDLKSKIDSLKARLGELPHDEKYEELKNWLESLEGKLSEKERTGDWRSVLSSFLTGFKDFLEMLTPIVNTVQKLQGQSNPTLEKSPPHTVKYRTQNELTDKDLEEIEKHIREAEGG